MIFFTYVDFRMVDYMKKVFIEVKAMVYVNAINLTVFWKIVIDYYFEISEKVLICFFKYFLVSIFTQQF